MDILEKLYKEAEKKGEEEKSYKNYESEDREFGSHTDTTAFTYKTSKRSILTIRAICEERKGWGPTSDSEGKSRELEILREKKVICRASCQDWKNTERFSPSDGGGAGGERHEGSEFLPASGWKITEGKIPRRFALKRSK
jgi:hypothetical protein